VRQSLALEQRSVARHLEVNPQPYTRTTLNRIYINPQPMLSTYTYGQPCIHPQPQVLHPVNTLTTKVALDGELAGVRQSLALEQRSVARHLEVCLQFPSVKFTTRFVCIFQMDSISTSYRFRQ